MNTQPLMTNLPEGAKVRLRELVEASVRKVVPGVEDIEWNASHSGATIRFASGQTICMGMSTLERVVRGVPLDMWASLVDVHVALINEIQTAGEMLPWGDAKAALRVRVHDTKYSRGNSDVRRPIADGLIEVLVIDRPATIVDVHQYQAEAWGRSVDELFEIAYTNMADDHDHPVENCLVDGTLLRVVWGCHYGASHLAMLGNRIKSRHGAIVAIPSGDCLLFAELDRRCTLDTIKTLAAVGVDRWLKAPHPVVPDLYWWRPGKPLARLTKRTDTRLILKPPAELAQAMAELLLPGGGGHTRRARRSAQPAA